MGRFYLALLFFGAVIAAVLGYAGEGQPQRDAGAGAGVIMAERETRLATLHDDRSPRSTTDPSDGSSVVLERSGDGHFYADVEINGAPVHMLVDTGASGVALSREAARSAGVATSIGMNEVVGEGADGAVRGEQVRIERMRLGPASAEAIDAVVLSSGGMSLLGQDFLQRFTSVEIRDDCMVLR